ncbi:DNA polymerase [Paraburkholderia sp. BL23I1N1]|uniref:uracil-DNA glycosylase n=1 Tax=Paraburkholderia sp. BL23I1N1 TaxID=1938802 RepID=UPI000E73EFD1|nr:uracil-DNA glycosylase [Paraburkholderia sp. BL23I1N1]RKE35398.1 DNA polymerase [Paraburkholderia sp. BL23I1N1]
MAVHESVLEEFGLTPLWVRRGTSAAQETTVEAEAGQGAGALADQAARLDDPRAAAREASSVAHAPDSRQVASVTGTPRPAVRAGETRQADAARTQGERRPPPPAQEQAQGRMEAQSDARQPVQQPSPQSRASEPPAFDAPPDDDFAWFDDQPAHAPVEARREAPEPASIQTLDWDALSEQVAACQRCRLCEKRTNTVFGVGDRNADWMLIGEAPGENEDRLGEPFVGQAGKLLDNMLRSLTLARDSNVYIANLIKCRPPGNRNPEPDEVARCEPYLQRQVALLKPKLIVALGRFAAQSLLKTEASISSLRGRVHEYEGVPVIVTYHPAYLLRSLPDKAKAWADLCLARDTWLAAGGVPSSAAK